MVPRKEDWMAYAAGVGSSTGRGGGGDGDSSRSSSVGSSSNTVRVLARQLAEQSSSESYLADRYTANAYAEGESEYDEYQVAWRMLGFFIDCDNVSRYDDDDAYGGGSGSGDNFDGTYTSSGCLRYVLWAAYVDEDYEGGGIGEYQYWDRFNGAWDETPCSVTGEESRCAKMDCHLEGTDWKLLGLFKHRNPDDWMEQLFKHEGMCVWTSDEYSFMKGARKAWPTGCVLSNSHTTLSGKPIYFDTKPKAGGSITLGLYSDESCVEPYRGTMSAESVAGNLLAEAEASGSGDNGGGDYSSLSASEAQDMWDSALSAFQQCQPCVAHDLENYGYSGNSQGSSYGSYSPNYDDDGSYYDPSDFDCYDDADYLNVNQCMKFMAKTAMDTATMRDVVLAYRQGTLVEQVPVSGLETSRRSFWRKPSIPGMDVFMSSLYLIASLLILVYGISKFRKARKEANFAPNWSLKQPLVFT